MASIESQVKRLSALAQLVQMYAEFKGVTSTKALADAIGVSERSIRYAKAEECFRRNDASARKNASAGTGRMLPPEPEECFHGTEVAPVRAQNEYPSGIDSFKIVSKSREIEGLNGSTTRLVGQLAGWLAGDLRMPDEDSAFTILAGFVDVYGAKQVTLGMAELQSSIAQGSKPRDIGRWFSGYVKRAAVDPKPTQREARQTEIQAVLARRRAAAAAKEAGANG